MDVGGGLASLTRTLAAKNDYVLLDLLAHDGPGRLDDLRKDHHFDAVQQDWYDFEPAGTYDVVVANDLFPNVDQRLELFIEKFRPVAREIRVSLTWYNAPRFYLTKRIGAEEILCVLAWNSRMTTAALEPFRGYIKQAGFCDVRSRASVTLSQRPIGCLADY